MKKIYKIACGWRLEEIIYLKYVFLTSPKSNLAIDKKYYLKKNFNVFFVYKLYVSTGK